MTFLDQFSVILLDMKGTFVFGHDRFGPDEDYFATYQRVGGRNLDRAHVHRVVTASFERLFRAYCVPECFDDFPTVAEALRDYADLDERDLSALESVFAVHELGHVPPAHEKFLHEVARSHDLGIVSNIWSPPDRWLSAFRDSGLLDIFKTIVFSSEGRSIKPSRLLFDRALAAFPPDSVTLFVGDSLERDIIPAKALGLATAWITPLGSADSAADVVVESLPALAEVAA
jgi:putative hydrolase of the HAD superfamily